MGDAEEGAKQEALRQLLAEETKLLQTLERLRLAAVALNRVKQAEGLLQRPAAPRVWSLQNGLVVQVLTPDTLRTAEHVEVYRRLIASDGSSVDQRLSVLTRVRRIAAECGGKEAGELLGLIDRELDLLNRYLRRGICWA